MALNQSSVYETKSRFSIGIDERQEYHLNLHGPKERSLLLVRDIDEGYPAVESIYWFVGKVSGSPYAYTLPTSAKRSTKLHCGIGTSATSKDRNETKPRTHPL